MDRYLIYIYLYLWWIGYCLSFQNNEIICTNRNPDIKRNDLLVRVEEDGYEMKYEVLESHPELHKQRIIVKALM